MINRLLLSSESGILIQGDKNGKYKKQDIQTIAKRKNERQIVQNSYQTF